MPFLIFSISASNSSTFFASPFFCAARNALICLSQGIPNSIISSKYLVKIASTSATEAFTSGISDCLPDLLASETMCLNSNAVGACLFGRIPTAPANRPTLPVPIFLSIAE